MSFAMRVAIEPASPIRFRPRSAAAVTVASVVGVFAFCWPFLLHGNALTHAGVAHSNDAPWIFVAVLPLLHRGNWQNDPLLRVLPISDPPVLRTVGMIQRASYGRPGITQAIIDTLHSD